MIFSDEVKNAIYNRKKEVNKTTIILSKLLSLYDMEEHRHTVERLILAREADDTFVEEHIIFDFLNGDLWLDLEALYFYRDILQGFIIEEDYERFLERVKAEEGLRVIKNRSLRMYQSKSLLGLIKTIWNERKNKDMFPSETAICIRWSLMELLSRTRLPKVYYYISNFPIRLKLNLTAKVIKYRLATQGYK